VSVVLFNQLSILAKLLMTLAEYMEVDSLLPTSKLMTDADSLQVVSDPRMHNQQLTGGRGATTGTHYTGLS